MSDFKYKTEHFDNWITLTDDGGRKVMLRLGSIIGFRDTKAGVYVMTMDGKGKDQILVKDSFESIQKALTGDADGIPC